jgi:hypothetical protein
MISLFCLLTKLQFIPFPSILKENNQILFLLEKQNRQAASFVLNALWLGEVDFS